jgi:Flp pilus assembly protein TadG
MGPCEAVFRENGARLMRWSRGVGTFRRAWRKLRCNQRGVAMIEFAVVMPVLVLLMLPLVDLGMGFYTKTQVMTAAQAGAQYAFVNGWTGTNGATQTAILSAVTSATSLASISASPAPTLACGCSDGTTITYSSPGSFSQSDCATLTACANGEKPGAYVTVNAQANYTPLFTFGIFGGAGTLSASSTVRVE